MDTDYSDAFDRDGRDLVAAASQGSISPPRFRDDEISRVVELLAQGRSVLLIGAAGVGKTAVVHGVAARFAAGQPARGLVEIATSTVIAGTRYLGEWQSKVAALVAAAVARQAVLYVTDAWNLPSAGKTSNSETNVLDALRPTVEQRRLALLVEATPAVLRQMERVPRFVDLFERVELRPLTRDQVDSALQDAATARSVRIDAAGRRALVDLTTRFLPARPQPGPALDLLAHVAERAADLPAEATVPPAFVEQVFADHTGLPPFIVGRQATMKAADIRAFFAQHLVGQERAIDAVVECIALFKAGLQDPRKPLGTFLFVGPTGVGKTELARTLAIFLFGSPDRLLRFDLGEFKDFHSFELLLGNPRDPGRPAALVDPVRAQPFQIVLFDELEKAHENVWDALLGLLDEGRLTPPAGESVDFRSTIVICTSNVGAEGSDKQLGFGDGPGLAEREATVRKGLERQFRPELLNRFGQVVVFHPLSRDQVRAVARQELARVLQRQGITGRGLVVDVDDSALDLAIERGYDERYGARSLKRELQHSLVLPLAMAIMEQGPDSGQLLKVDIAGGRVRVRLLDTAHSRAARRESRPVRVEGRRFTRQALAEGIAAVVRQARDLASDADLDFLEGERRRLRDLRAEPDFWKHPHHAAQALRDLDWAERDRSRLTRLSERAQALQADLATAAGRSEYAQLGGRLVQLEQHLHDAHRELVVLGRAGLWDALVEISPVGATGPGARDMVASVLSTWAEHRRFELDWLCEPLDDDEPCVVAVRGHYASGLLAAEAGLHRHKTEDGSSVARVRVGPWTDHVVEPQLSGGRALRRKGRLGHGVRSQLQVQVDPRSRTRPLILQGPRTLQQARDLALELAGAWARMPGPSDRRVRRYDAAAGLVKDALLGNLNLHPGKFPPERLHQVLCQRIDQLALDQPA